MQISSAAETERIAPNAAPDESSFIWTKRSHLSIESNQNIVDTIGTDGDQRHMYSEDVVSIGYATRSEEMNGSVASNREQSLSESNPTTCDEEANGPNDPSSAVMMPSVKDGTAAALPNVDQTHGAACSDAVDNATGAGLAPVVTSFSGDRLNCDNNDISPSPANAMKTQNEGVNSSGETRTSLTSLYIRPPAVKDNLINCKLKLSRADTTVSEDQLPEPSAEKVNCLNTCNVLPAASRTMDVSEDYTFVTKPSENRQSEECRPASVDDTLMTVYNGVHDDVLLDASSSSPAGSLVKTDSDKCVADKSSDNSHDDSKSTSVRNCAVSYRPPAQLAVKRIAVTRQAPSNNDNDSRPTRTAPKSATAVDAVQKQQHESAVYRVALKSSNGSFSVAPSPSEINNCVGKPKNSCYYELKTNRLRAFTATTDGGDNSPVQEIRTRADEKERAKRLLHSVLAPVCRVAGPPSTARRPPPVSGNQLNSRLAADLPETTARTRESLLSNAATHKSALSLTTTDMDTNGVKTSYRAGRRAPCVLPSNVGHSGVTAPPTAGCYDDNNNKRTADRDVIKTPSPTARRSRGGGDVMPSSWQWNHVGDSPSSWQPSHVTYDVTTLPRTQRRCKLHVSTGDEDDRQMPSRRQLSEDGGRCLDVVAGSTGTVEDGGGSAVVRRSLSLPPVIERSEAFIVAASSSSSDRDRVVLPMMPLASPTTARGFTPTASPTQLSAVSE